jgi:hypothetical protein
MTINDRKTIARLKALNKQFRSNPIEEVNRPSISEMMNDNKLLFEACVTFLAEATNTSEDSVWRLIQAEQPRTMQRIETLYNFALNLER